MDKNNDHQNANPEVEVKALGKKIVMLLHSADLPEDVQVAIMQMVPEMTIEQINELIAMLSDYVMHGANADVAIKERLMQIKDNYDKKQAATNTKTMDALEELEKEL